MIGTVKSTRAWGSGRLSIGEPAMRRSARKPLSIGVPAALAALAIAALGAPAAQAAFPGANGPILFEREDILWTVSPAGPVNSERKLRKAGAPVESLDYSPNGKFFATALDLGAGQSWQVVVAKSTGKKPYVVTSKARKCLSSRMPSWSPNGKQIAFICNDKGFPASFEVYTIAADGRSKPRRITEVNDVDYVKWNPADPNEIAFSSGQYLYTVPASGGTPTLLNGDPPGITGRRWNDFDFKPDGSQLVVEDGEGDIRLMDSTTGAFGPSLVSGNDDAQIEPSFSPDGNSIVFINAGSSGFDVQTIPVSGAAAGFPLTSTPLVSERYPVWRPMP